MLKSYFISVCFQSLQVINNCTDIYYSVAAEGAGGLVSSRLLTIYILITDDKFFKLFSRSTSKLVACHYRKNRITLLS